MYRCPFKVNKEDEESFYRISRHSLPLFAFLLSSLSSYFLKKKDCAFVTISTLKQTEQITFLLISLVIIIQTFQIIVAHTILDAKVTTR